MSVNCQLGYAFYWAGQYDQAIQQLRRALDLDPNYSQTYFVLGRAYLGKGMHQEALEALEKGTSLYYGGRRSSDLLGYAYGVAGQRTKALRLVERLKPLWRRGDLDAGWDLARVYTGLGEKDRALELLEKAYDEHYPNMVLIKVDPQVDSLRSDPRFQDLLRRMNFPP